MISNICSLPKYQVLAVFLAAQLLYMLFERWLGRTEKTQYSNFIDLFLGVIWNLVKVPFTPKQETQMPLIPIPVMSTPFDVKNLVDRLKNKGIDQAEEIAKVIANETCDWLAESCVMHPNPYVKLGAAVVMAAKPELLKAVDKIDGQVG
jgi:hypothetical protein